MIYNRPSNKWKTVNWNLDRSINVGGFEKLGVLKPRIDNTKGKFLLIWPIRNSVQSSNLSFCVQTSCANKKMDWVANATSQTFNFKLNSCWNLTRSQFWCHFWIFWSLESSTHQTIIQVLVFTCPFWSWISRHWLKKTQKHQCSWQLLAFSGYENSNVMIETRRYSV